MSGREIEKQRTNQRKKSKEDGRREERRRNVGILVCGEMLQKA